MKFTPIAAATLIPASLAGIALSIMPLVSGTPALAAAHDPARVARTASHVRSTSARADDKQVAKAAASPSARPTAVSPAAAAAAVAAPAQAAQPQQPAAPPMSAAESSFEQCVAWRESSNTPTDPDGLFGILPSVWAQLGYSGTAGQAPVAQQLIAFNRLYQEYGAQPWAPSDGC